MLVSKALVTHADKHAEKTCLHNTKRHLDPPVEGWQLRRALAQQHTIKSFEVADGVARVVVDYLPGDEPVEPVEPVEVVNG